jgi:hypothetical protein
VLTVRHSRSGAPGRAARQLGADAVEDKGQAEIELFGGRRAGGLREPPRQVREVAVRGGRIVYRSDRAEESLGAVQSVAVVEPGLFGLL